MRKGSSQLHGRTTGIHSGHRWKFRAARSKIENIYNKKQKIHRSPCTEPLVSSRSTTRKKRGGGGEEERGTSPMHTLDLPYRRPPRTNRHPPLQHRDLRPFDWTRARARTRTRTEIETETLAPARLGPCRRSPPHRASEWRPRPRSRSRPQPGPGPGPGPG